MRRNLFLDAEFVDRRTLISLPRLEERAWKRRLIGAVRIMLRFQTESFVLLEAAVAFRAIQKVAAVELNRRFRGAD